jgi:hypothetical protein
MKITIRKVIHKAVSMINLVVYHTGWYQAKFKDCKKFWKRFHFNIDAVNLGSNSALYSFDYEGLKIVGYNWAIGPQSLPQDFSILKTYHSYLKRGAVVIIVLCPFSSCNKVYKDEELEKYYTILHPGVIKNFSLTNQIRIYNIKDNPLRYAMKQSLKALIIMPVYLMKTVYHLFCLQLNRISPRNVKMMEKDSHARMDWWKKQFEIKDLETEFPFHLCEGRKKRIEVLTEMIDFCIERELKPVIVIPPMTKYLSSKMSATFRETYIYSFIREANVKNIPFLDYMDDERFNDASLYFNSFFLNLRGRKIFTKQVLKDLNILK